MNLRDQVRRIIGRGNPATDFYAIAKRVGRVPDAELTVAAAALTGGGPIADLIVRQLREAGDVWRHLADDGTYELRVSTIDDLTIRGVPRAGWDSPWIPAVAMPGDRAVELRLVVVAAGIVGILGRTADGARWPARWTARTEDLDAIRARAPWLRLPTSDAIDEARSAAAETIEAWLGDAAALRGFEGVLRADPPATDDAISGLEEREGVSLPDAYRSLLRRAEGVEIGDVVVMGTADAYRLDIPGPARLVISPPDEDGAITLAETGEVVHVGIGDATTDGRIIGPDLREWVLAAVAGAPAETGRS